MSLEYQIKYIAENHYEHWVEEAHWQFLIIPEENKTQEFVKMEFANSIHAINEYSVNGYGFKTIRVQPKQKFKKIAFEASFHLIKKEVNPFDFDANSNFVKSFDRLSDIDFKVDFERFLRITALTQLRAKDKSLFVFNQEISIFDNLQKLNHWVFIHLYYKTGVTNVNTKLDEIIDNRHGVCQDFAHLFCALAKANRVPARYVSGYLHQGNGYFGDLQMHAWAEAFVPNIGWVAFDPTNDILADTNHIKVAHGKDYTDCAPLKGVVYTQGKNETSHSVQVASQQQ